MRTHSHRRIAAGLTGTALLLVTTAAFGQAYPYGTTVANTVHNVSRTAQSASMTTLLRNYGEVCVYCHTPHGGTITAPLWNRSLPSGPYQMYTSTTIDMTMDASPTGVSLACLSCHDGTIGLDVIINVPNSYSGAAAVGTNIQNCASNCHTGATPAGSLNFSQVNLGTDLRNDHPVSVAYDPTRDAAFNTAASVTSAGLVLYEGKVQCGTCHNPHSQANRPFLRRANADSQLCLTCHIK